MNTNLQRPFDAPLDLATTLFGRDPGDEQQATPLAFGKLWGTLPTGRSSVFQVRVGWLGGERYFQFVEHVGDDTEKCTQILVGVSALADLAESLSDLARSEGVR